MLTDVIIVYNLVRKLGGMHIPLGGRRFGFATLGAVFSQDPQT